MRFIPMETVGTHIVRTRVCGILNSIMRCLMSVAHIVRTRVCGI